jgi:glycosyltransferase involved in cell wall biosynthesis
LIVVDDGDHAANDVLPTDSRVRYVRLDHRQTIGAKRNLACDLARGQLIVHWDDDDWHAPWRLSYQVAALTGSGADACGLASLLFYEPQADRAWRYVYPTGRRPWLAGGTLCYRKEFWRRQPFRDISIGEDARFLWTARSPKLSALPDETFFVALVHSGNTSPKRTSDRWWVPVPVEEVHRLLGPDLAQFAQDHAGAVSDG